MEAVAPNFLGQVFFLDLFESVFLKKIDLVGESKHSIYPQ